MSVPSSSLATINFTWVVIWRGRWDNQFHLGGHLEEKVGQSISPGWSFGGEGRTIRLEEKSHFEEKRWEWVSTRIPSSNNRANFFPGRMCPPSERDQHAPAASFSDIADSSSPDQVAKRDRPNYPAFSLQNPALAEPTEPGSPRNEPNILNHPLLRPPSPLKQASQKHRGYQSRERAKRYGRLRGYQSRERAKRYGRL